MIRENESGVFISGVQEVQVKKMEDCLQLLQLGERNRAFAFTELNAHSSRSHAIVLLTILKRKKAIAQTKSSKVTCCSALGRASSFNPCLSHPPEWFLSRSISLLALHAARARPNTCIIV